MRAKVLIVDDDANILAAYARLLHQEFEVDTAEGGERGLDAMRTRGPYATVLCDMRMPGMSGARFLASARQSAPDTVRMLLTGHADLEAVLEAVNEGNIFRFLTKPCPKDALIAAIQAAAEQYQLIRSERDLLEKTLVGSIKVMADFLSASSPQAFSRSLQIAHFVRHIAGNFHFDFRWRLDTAATLSQLGCVTLDPELIQNAFAGAKLSPEDQARFNAHPEAAMRLLGGIPRLEHTAWMIGQQLMRVIPAQAPGLPEASMKETVLGAKTLKLAVAFDRLRVELSSEAAAVARLRTRTSEFGWELLDALTDIRPVGRRMEPRRMSTLKLSTGMVLDQEIRNKQGMLLVAKGQEITAAVLIKLENFARAGLIDRDVQALVPM